MENRWEFDKDYVEFLLKKVDKILNSKFISKKRREDLNNDKQYLYNFINNNFSCVEKENLYKNKEMPELIAITLVYMKHIYKSLGPKLMDWIIELNKSKIFNFPESKDINILSMDEQAELTIKNYEKYSKYLLEDVKYLINNTKQIQEVQDKKFESFCYNPEIVKIPFIVINSSDEFHSFNHELHHGIENYKCLDSHFLYLELGAIFFELYCLDEFSNKQGYLKSGDFDFRFNDTNNFLSDISKFFMLVKEFAKKKFDISYFEFVDACEKYLSIPSEKLKNYLIYFVLDDEGLEESMIYTFSYLKAIELRDKYINKNCDVMDILEPYYKKKKFNFNIESNAFEIYNKYVEDMNSRVRKL